MTLLLKAGRHRYVTFIYDTFFFMCGLWQNIFFKWWVVTIYLFFSYLVLQKQKKFSKTSKPPWIPNGAPLRWHTFNWKWSNFNFKNWCLLRKFPLQFSCYHLFLEGVLSQSSKPTLWPLTGVVTLGLRWWYLEQIQLCVCGLMPGVNEKSLFMKRLLI